MVLVDCESQRRHADGNTGVYEGTMLVLAQDGALHETTAGGSWSQWQGAWSTQERTIAPMTARQAMDSYDLDDCLTALAGKLQKQASGGTGKVTGAALERADRLKALARLSK